jgi:hypothetical protein
VSEVLHAQSQMTNQEEHTIVNDLEPLVDCILSLKNQTIVFVLDNMGFELFTDLCFADILLTHNPTLTILFHCKTIPWFVSDTLIPDFYWTLNEVEKMGLLEMAKRWKDWVNQGKWVLKEDPFWCTPLSFWNLRKYGTEAYEDISVAGLTIYKGDLNYRKLVGDGDWPTTTPFSEAIGPLNSIETRPFVALRTSKSDVVVGLAEGQAEQLFKKDPKWMIDGKWGMIQFYQGHKLPTEHASN